MTTAVIDEASPELGWLGLLFERLVELVCEKDPPAYAPDKSSRHLVQAGVEKFGSQLLTAECRAALEEGLEELSWDHAFSDFLRVLSKWTPDSLPHDIGGEVSKQMTALVSPGLRPTADRFCRVYCEIVRIAPKFIPSGTGTRGNTQPQAFAPADTLYDLAAPKQLVEGVAGMSTMLAAVLGLAAIAVRRRTSEFTETWQELCLLERGTDGMLAALRVLAGSHDSDVSTVLIPLAERPSLATLEREYSAAKLGLATWVREANASGQLVYGPMEGSRREVD